MKLLDRILGTETNQKVARARDALDDIDDAMDRALALADARLARLAHLEHDGERDDHRP